MKLGTVSSSINIMLAILGLLPFCVTVELAWEFDWDSTEYTDEVWRNLYLNNIESSYLPVRIHAVFPCLLESSLNTSSKFYNVTQILYIFC